MVCSEHLLLLSSGYDLAAAVRERTPTVKLTSSPSLPMSSFPDRQLRMLPGSVDLIHCEDECPAIPDKVPENVALIPGKID
jgi:hypothetical protein